MKGKQHRKIFMALLAACILLQMPMQAFAAKQPENRQEAEAMVEEAAQRTSGHNVQVCSYSDTSDKGYIYESIGSGVILQMDGNMVYMVTAAHCLKYAHTKVEFADGSSYEAVVAYKNPARDVGFLLVPQASLTPQTAAAILPAAGADSAAIGEVQGNVLFAVSSSEGANAVILPGVLDSHSVVYPNNEQQKVLQFYSDATYGSSGGGVYTLDGIWIGNVSGGDTRGKCWAVPYTDIMGEYTAWMNQLLAQQQANAS